MKIVILGNAATGKTRLAKALEKQYGIPVLHIDKIQFTQLLQIQPLNETRAKIKDFMNQESWIIEGYGPLDQLQNRLDDATHIILLDPPLWRIYAWALRRLFTLMLRPRPELPEGANELRWVHIRKLFATLHKVHYGMRPEVLRVLKKPQHISKVLHLTQPSQWAHGLGPGFPSVGGPGLAK